MGRCANARTNDVNRSRNAEPATAQRRRPELPAWRGIRRVLVAAQQCSISLNEDHQHSPDPLSNDLRCHRFCPCCPRQPPTMASFFPTADVANSRFDNDLSEDLIRESPLWIGKALPLLPQPLRHAAMMRTGPLARAAEAECPVPAVGCSPRGRLAIRSPRGRWDRLALGIDVAAPL